MSDVIHFSESEIRRAIDDPSSLVSLEIATNLQYQEDKLHDFLRTSPTTKLSTLISECIAIIDLCDPSKSLKSSNWFRKFVGSELATKVCYQASITKLDELLEKAKKQANLIDAAFKNISKLIFDLNTKSAELSRNLVLGEHIIAHHLGEVEEQYRPFFKKRMTNLNALISANEMAIEQFQLAQSNALTIIHRFEEMETMVLPSWKSLAMQRSIAREFSPAQGEKVKRIYVNVKQDLTEIHQLFS